MALFNNFPWTNFHELNLDWLVQKVASLEASFPEGTIGVNKGGTGADNAAQARENLEIDAPHIPLEEGGNYMLDAAISDLENSINALAGNVKYRIFRLVSDLGQIPGTATASACWAAMSVGDILIAPPSQFRPDEVPESSGTLIMVRNDGTSGSLRFYGNNTYSKKFVNNYPGSTWYLNYDSSTITPVSNGGTGADNAADALHNLGIDFTGEVLSVAGVGAGPTGDVPLNSYDLLNVYESITDLGLGSGSTISAVWNALNYGDRITFPASEISDGPSGVSGTIDIYRGTASQTGWISFYGAAESDGDYRMHLSGGNPDGTWLSVLTSAAIITEKVSLDTASVAAYDNHEYTKSVAKTGYTPLGIIGIQGNGSTGMMITDYYLYGTTAHIWSQNTTNASKTVSYEITILYRKN